MYLLTTTALILAGLSGGLAEPVPAAEADPQLNAVSLVRQFEPSATITSISPEQSAALASNVPAFVSAYTASNPLQALQASVFAAAIFNPPPAGVRSSLQDLLAGAPGALATNPVGFLNSINGVVSGQAFATDIYTYQSGLIQGLRTVVASDLSLSLAAQTTSPGASASAPAATSRSSAGAGAAGPVPTACAAAFGAAAVAAVGALAL